MVKSDDNKKVHIIDKSDVLDEKIQYVRVDDYHDDEVSLVDLVGVFIKRRILFLSVILLTVFLGVGYVLNKPVIYSYFVSLEIGRKANGDGLVEDAGTLLNKIHKYYMPVASKKFLDKYPDLEGAPTVVVSQEKSTNIIFLESKGTIENQSINFEFINMLVDAVVADHKKISAIYSKEMEFSKAQLNDSIKRLKDQNQLLISQKGRLKDKESFLKKRIALIEKSLIESRTTRQIAANNTNTESKAWALLMIDNDLRASQEGLSSLEEQMNIGLKEESDRLDNRMADNIRTQSELVSKIAQIQLKLENFLETRTLSEPLKSINPVGKSKTFTILISFIVGVLAAFFAVFIVEFSSKVREQV